mgnify:CR=1 FL=1
MKNLARIFLIAFILTSFSSVFAAQQSHKSTAAQQNHKYKISSQNLRAKDHSSKNIAARSSASRMLKNLQMLKVFQIPSSQKIHVHLGILLKIPREKVRKILLKILGKIPHRILREIKHLGARLINQAARMKLARV